VSQLIKQKDDGNRNALHSVIKKSENPSDKIQVSTFQDILKYFVERGEFF